MWWGMLSRFLAVVAFALVAGVTEPRPDPILLPIEVMGEDGATASRSMDLRPDQAISVHSLWLRVHGVHYAEQASIQINSSTWIPLRNESVNVAGSGKNYGGIGGAFATLELTLALPPGTAVAGVNTVRFRFNHSDGLASGYRVLAFNFLARDGSNILSSAAFAEDEPEAWKPPLMDEASIRAGKELWLHAQLVASSRPNSSRIRARCADCHAQDGRDLKYFNFSNASIIARSRFHGLSTREGEQIASYIRTLAVPNPGRPWNPPYQPGPGLDRQPVANWAAGAGLQSVLNHDAQALPHLLAQNNSPPNSPAAQQVADDPDWHSLAARIGSEVFRPDGDLNVREIPIALQLPDWSQWLPRIHPKDAWGDSFDESEFASLYDGAVGKERPSLRGLLASSRMSGASLRAVVPAWDRWTVARRRFLGRILNVKSNSSPDVAEKVYSTQLWQMAKTWEMTQEFELEGQGAALLGASAEPRTWCNTIPAQTAPAAAHIPNGPAGIGGSALTNEYLSASWYELQIILNSGNHRHRDRTPVDWVYLIGHFHDLYVLTREPEPVRLLVAVTKALQSTDPHLGPDDFSQGWRPDQNIDPRIMISSQWQPIFKPLPDEVRRALTESLLSAWMDKNLQYPIIRYLPLPSLQRDYKVQDSYADFSGGKVWNAAERFRAAGVSEDVVDRLHNWGMAYTDRASRLQYH
jgi:hypothetical protein